MTPEDEVTTLANAVRGYEVAMSSFSKCSNEVRIAEDSMARKKHDLEAATAQLAIAKARVVDCAKRIGK
jgi:hypothetical protein